jgi:hypothetical protein
MTDNMRTVFPKLILMILLLCLLSACAGIESEIPVPVNGSSTSTPGQEVDEAETRILVTWQRSGGFAGICQNMEIQTDGSYRIEDCRNDEVLAESILDPDELDRLKKQASQMSTATWETPALELVPDAFNDSFTFYGTGQNSFTNEELRLLNDEFAELAQRLSK